MSQYTSVLSVTLVLEPRVMNNRPGSRAGEQRGELPVFMTPLLPECCLKHSAGFLL